MSFTKKFESTKLQNLYLIKGEDNGFLCWHYVLVDQLKLPLLKAKMANLPSDIDVSKYGKVIYSGWGEEPTGQIKEMADKGDFSGNFSQTNYSAFTVQPVASNGERFFAFICVPEHLSDQFYYLMNSESSNLNLYQWGYVLKWGWGEPTQQEIEEFEILKKAFANSPADA